MVGHLHHRRLHNHMLRSATVTVFAVFLVRVAAVFFAGVALRPAVRVAFFAIVSSLWIDYRSRSMPTRTSDPLRSIVEANSPSL